MDERKWSFKRLLKYSLVAGVGLFALFLVYGLIIYAQTKQIDDPTKCFETKMYKVRLCPKDQNYVRYSQVPKHFFQSLILSEDASFWSHKGFDWFEIKESFRRNIVEWRFARGGSTLTQQLAKNLYLSPRKSFGRKFKEIFIAKQLEKKLKKSQILEKYVNVVEFGKNLYGVQNASQKYFYKSVSDLNILESIYLVSLLPSPVRLSKSFEKKKLSSNNLWRMKVILKRLYRTKKISDEKYIYIEMLLDQEDWPFPHYSSEFLEEDYNIEDELLKELDSEDLLEEEEDSLSVEEEEGIQNEAEISGADTTEEEEIEEKSDSGSEEESEENSDENQNQEQSQPEEISEEDINEEENENQITNDENSDPEESE